MTNAEIVYMALVAAEAVAVACLGRKSIAGRNKINDPITTQEELKRKEDEVIKIEKDFNEKRIAVLEATIGSTHEEFKKLNTTVQAINSGMNNVVKLTNLNFQLSQTLSQSIYSIGTALNSSDSINSSGLSEELSRNRDSEKKIIAEVCKIIY